LLITVERLYEIDWLALHNILTITSRLPKSVYKFEEGAKGCIGFLKSSFKFSFSFNGKCQKLLNLRLPKEPT